MHKSITLLFAILILFPVFVPQVSAAKDNIYDRDIYITPVYYYVLKKSKTFIEQGRHEKALKILSPFISEPLKYPDAAADYIAALVWTGNYQKAVYLYEKLPPSFPTYLYLFRNMAKAYYELNDFERAIELYQTALDKNPEDMEARKGLVLSLMHRGDYEMALSDLKKYQSQNPQSLELLLVQFDLLIQAGRYAEAVDMYGEVERRDVAVRENLYRKYDDYIASLPKQKKQEIIKSLNRAGVSYEKFQVLVLILSRDFRDAIKEFEESGQSFESFPFHIQSWVAWAYFKAGYTEKSAQYFQSILDSMPGYIRAQTGLAYCLAEKGQNNDAIEMLDGILQTSPDNTEVLYARAHVYEKAGKYWLARKEYERIIELTGNNPVAERLRLRVISDIGSSERALSESIKVMPDEAGLHDSIMADMIRDRIRWNERPAALIMARSRFESNQTDSSRYDYIVALVENKEMKEAVELYEELVHKGVTPPTWVTENIAGAYLYLRNPHKALELYELVLSIKPTFASRIGKFYALQELRRFDEAWLMIDSIDRELPEVIRRGKNIRANWQKMETTLGRGWLYLYEDRLEDGDNYFWKLRTNAPANTAIRTGLSHAYLWRGWPRKALREFRIVESLDPEYISFRTGEIAAQNALAYKDDAREDAQELLMKHPKNRHVQDVVRQLSLEEMEEIIAEFAISGDSDGFDEIKARISLFHPITLYTGAYGFVSWQKAESSDQKAYFRRTGVGIKHIFNRFLTARQEFSTDYYDGGDFGSFTELIYTPDDYWRIDLSYDVFTTDIPMRARVFDIDADKASIGITYRESEMREYSLSGSYQKFSDDNERYQGLIGFEQGLYVRNNWRMRLFFDIYGSTNSRDDAPYFNPENDFSVTITHMTEQTIKRLYREAFVHRLYLTVGGYSQSGYSGSAIGSVRYEHDIDFSDVHSLLYGANLSSRTYDGDRVTGYGFDMRWRLLF